MELNPLPSNAVPQSTNPEVRYPQFLEPLHACSYVFPKGRHCRQAVASRADTYCATHSHYHAAFNPAHDPLAELAAELGDAREIEEVRKFIARVIKLACQNRISISRATALTFMANSLLNAIRLALSEERFHAKDDPDELRVDFTGFPRPDRQVANLREPALGLEPGPCLGITHQQQNSPHQPDASLGRKG